MQSDLLSRVPGIIHGFGDLKRPLPPEFQQDWDKNRAHSKQVHGTHCVELITPGQEAGEADAFFSRLLGAPVSIVTADCVPVLLARQDGGAVAAVHAGWRGTRAGILRELWRNLEAQGESPRDWVAAIGPAIGPCCYQVSSEIAEEFEREFKWMGAGKAVPRERMMDLPAMNAAELAKLGLAAVTVVRACTKCSVDSQGAPLFHSYRREGGGTRQWSVISRKAR